MMVVCRASNCPYNWGGKFCKKEFPSIDQNGCCSVLWRKGRQRQRISDELDRVKQINIEDAVFEEWNQQKEEEKKRREELIVRSKRASMLVRSSVKRRPRLSNLIKIR